MRTARTWGLAGLLGWFGVLGGFTGCSREEPSHASVENAASAAADPSFAAALPEIGDLPGYVGSQSCQECHQDQFQSWHRTYHRTMTQIARPETVRANFQGVTLTNAGVRFQLSQAGEELRVHLEHLTTPGPNAAPAGSLDTRVTLVTGSHHMQVFWVPGGDGNMQVGFPFTWLIPEARWVPRNATFIRPPGFAHQSEVWNVVCSRCHATGVEPRVDAAQHRMDSRVAELGISCEACHGPGARHVAARRAAGPNAAKPSAIALQEEIVQPEKLDPARSAEVCGFCHSMKWIDRSEGWRQRGFRYRPGERLEATTPLILPRRVGEIPGLQAYLAKNPGLLEDFFWSDGMGRVSGRELNSLVESPCYRGGKFSCLSCHSLHESDPDDLLARNRTGSGACVQCHDAYREPGAVQRHTHHLANSTGSDCYNCHMPHTTYGVLSAIRSHQISSPRVDDQLKTGRPNACNLCHLDQPLAWTAKHLADWYQQPAPVLEEPMRHVAESVRLALTGDAGQRALIAWHFGWEPARNASAPGWSAPILGVLLDDPYAAIRCLADRSLRSSSNLMPPGYDFVLDPSDRPSAAQQVWAAWVRTEPSSKSVLPESVVVRRDPSSALDQWLGPWLAKRNDKAMRLRE